MCSKPFTGLVRFLSISLQQTEVAVMLIFFGYKFISYHPLGVAVLFPRVRAAVHSGRRPRDGEEDNALRLGDSALRLLDLSEPQ